jgi:type VI secretion system protein ImpA
MHLKSLAKAGRWADVLEYAEQAMATECGRAWLDVQRYVVTACDNLGYDAVAAAIRSELKCLLNDYPALSTATLLDETGAANPDTSAWLKDGMK